MRVFIPFEAASGEIYELEFEYDYNTNDPIYLPDRLVENDSGGIMPSFGGFGVSGQIFWPSLVEMTHELKIEFISMNSDPGN